MNIGNCKNCVFWQPNDKYFGKCNNQNYFHYGYGSLEGEPNEINVLKSGAWIEEDAGWGWVTSPGFGCVNFKQDTKEKVYPDEPVKEKIPPVTIGIPCHNKYKNSY